MRLIVLSLAVLLSVLVAPASEKTHAFVVKGSDVYNGSAPTTLIDGYFLADRYDVTDGFSLSFDYGGSTKTAMVIVDRGGSWAKIYQRQIGRAHV